MSAHQRYEFLSPTFAIFGAGRFLFFFCFRFYLFELGISLLRYFWWDSRFKQLRERMPWCRREDDYRICINPGCKERDRSAPFRTSKKYELAVPPFLAFELRENAFIILNPVAQRVVSVECA